MRSLQERLVEVPQTGEVTWLGLRPAFEAPMTVVTGARALEGRGLEGDRVVHGRAGSKRQVTLMQQEHLAVVAALAHVPEVTAETVRRNVLVRGVNLLAFVKRRFALGDEVILVGTGPCAPCGKMDVAIGPGGFHAMRGHGGITALVDRGGAIAVGARVRLLG